MQAKRVDWRIDGAIVCALLLSAGIGLAFVFYRPEASPPDGRMIATDSQDTTTPVRQPPDNQNQTAQRPVIPSSPDNLAAKEPPKQTGAGDPTEPPTNLGAESPPPTSQPPSKAAAAHSRAPKTSATIPASKKPVPKQAPTKMSTPTRKARKEN